MYGLGDVDEPTKPFSRGEIERKRASYEELESKEPAVDEASRQDDALSMGGEVRATGLGPGDGAQAPEELDGGAVGADADNEGFMLDGQWFQVSLEAFQHVGLSGPPDGMIGSADFECVSGSIGQDEDSPVLSHSRHAQAYATQGQLEPNTGEDLSLAEEDVEDVDDIDDEVVWREPRRWWGALGLGASLLAAFLWVTMGTKTEEEDVKAEPQTDEVGSLGGDERQDLVEEIVAGGSEDQGEADSDPSETEGGPDEKKSRKKQTRYWTKMCRVQREAAKTAKASGDWNSLESLTRDYGCWKQRDQGVALQLEALFELEKLTTCIQKGTGSGSAKVKKWVSNCKRAQQ